MQLNDLPAYRKAQARPARAVISLAALRELTEDCIQFGLGDADALIGNNAMERRSMFG
jgi:hypothetical protein